MRLPALLAAALALLFAACAAKPPPPKDILLPFLGQWTGTLEYRDFKTERRVTLPTELAVKRVSPVMLSFAYAYDDGPGKTVRSTAEVELERAQRAWRSIEGVNVFQYAVSGLEDFGGPEGGTLVLEGEGKENNQAVTVRITMVLTPTTYTATRESRRPGGEFQFRNRYTLTRR